ncbi:hypothetical protein BH23PLA1_BH23PLA1_26000 [soil metagenome]
MSRNRNDRLGLAVVVGLSLAAALGIQTTRNVRVGMPGAMLHHPHVNSSSSQAEHDAEDSRLDLAGTQFTHLDPSRMP